MNPFRSFALGGLCAVSLAAPAFATVQDGIAAWQRGDYAGAVAQWSGPAAAGDADAEYNLAQAYKLGKGVPADPTRALTLYRAAADQGHPQGQAVVGLTMFQNGDRQAAMPWIEKAADAGDPRAEYVLATALFNGDLEPKNWVRAYALMSHAASSGLPQASRSLAEMNTFVTADQRAAALAMAARFGGAPKIASADVPPSRAADHIPAIKAVKAAPSPPASPAPSPPPPVQNARPPKEIRPAPAKAPAASGPRPMASPGGKWGIQLGAFSSAALAQAQWSKVRGAPGLAGLRAAGTPAGAMVRLRAGPIASRADALRACAAAKSAGADCIIVAP